MALNRYIVDTNVLKMAFRIILMYSRTMKRLTLSKIFQFAPKNCAQISSKGCMKIELNVGH